MIIAAVNTVIALVYYTKVVKSAFMDDVPESIPADELREEPMSPALKLALGLTAVLVLLLGIFPALIADLSQYMTEVFAALF